MTPAKSTIYICELKSLNYCIYLIKAKVFFESNLFAELQNKSIHYSATLSPWEMSIQHNPVSFITNHQSISYIRFPRINSNNEDLNKDLKNLFHTKCWKKTWYEITINNAIYYATIISGSRRQMELSDLLAQWKEHSKERIELRIGLTSYHDLELMLLEPSYFNVYKTLYNAIIEKVVKLPANKWNTFSNTESSEIDFNSDLQTYLNTQHSLFSQPRNTSSSTSTTSSTLPDSLQNLPNP